MHHSIMFISLIPKSSLPNQTTNVDSAHTNSLAPLNKAWLSLQHLSQQSQAFSCIRQTSPTPNIIAISQEYGKYTQKFIYAIRQSTGVVTQTIFTKLVLSQQLLNRTPRPDQIKISKTETFLTPGHRQTDGRTDGRCLHIMHSFIFCKECHMTIILHQLIFHDGS